MLFVGEDVDACGLIKDGLLHSVPMHPGGPAPVEKDNLLCSLRGWRVRAECGGSKRTAASDGFHYFILPLSRLLSPIKHLPVLSFLSLGANSSF